MGPKSNQVSGIKNVSYVFVFFCPFNCLFDFHGIDGSNLGNWTANEKVEPWQSCWTTIRYTSTF